MNASRESILAAKPSAPVPLDVPEWGGVVYLKILSVADQQALAKDREAEDIPVVLLIHAVVDEQGHPLLHEEDVPQFVQQEFPLIMRVFAEAARLNGMTTDEFEEAMSSFAKAGSTHSSTASLSLSGFPQGNSRSE